jgi:hypothetical protein
MALTKIAVAYSSENGYIALPKGVRYSGGGGGGGGGRGGGGGGGGGGGWGGGGGGGGGKGVGGIPPPHPPHIEPELVELYSLTCKFSL